MKTNLGLTTTDEERLLIGQALGLNRMVTRKELVAEVERHVDGLKRGTKAQRQPVPEVVPIAADEPDTEPDRAVHGFVPSRGDEDYLFKARDPALKAILARLLDITEELDAYTWKQLEKIRDR